MSTRRADRGYVSILVLLMTALLATLAAVLLHVARPGLELTRLGVDQLRADALLDAGTSAAGYLLFGAKREPKAVDGKAFSLSDGAVTLAVTDDGGRVDLNTSDLPLLAGLFSAAGCTSMTPGAFAARVADWRDEDSEQTKDGAEANDYNTAGLAYGPRNGPFQSVEELLLLLGLSAADFDRLAPFVTVFNPTGKLDVMYAARTGLLAVPQMAKGDVDGFLQKRKGASRDDDFVHTFADTHGDYLADDAVESYRVDMTAKLVNGYSKAAEAVLISSHDETALYRIVAWTTGPAAERP